MADRFGTKVVASEYLGDVHQTRELGELVRGFVSPKDATEKEL